MNKENSHTYQFLKNQFSQSNNNCKEINTQLQLVGYKQYEGEHESVTFILWASDTAAKIKFNIGCKSTLLHDTSEPYLIDYQKFKAAYFEDPNLVFVELLYADTELQEKISVISPHWRESLEFCKLQDQAAISSIHLSSNTNKRKTL